MTIEALTPMLRTWQLRATVEFYLQAMKILDRSGVPYLVGGAYALACYTGIVRHTKDFDTFMRVKQRVSLRRRAAPSAT